MLGRIDNGRIPVLLLFAVVVALLPSRVAAQSPSWFVSAQASDNFSTAAIPAFDNGGIRCGTFTSGKKWSLPSFKAGVSFPKSDAWSFGASLGFFDLSTSFSIDPSATAATPKAYDQTSKQYVSIDRQRTYDAKLGMLSASLFAVLNPFSRLNLNAGPYLGYMIRHQYNESEQVLTANAVYVENDRTSRTIGSGSITNINTLQFGLNFEASYDLAFQPSLWLRPSFNWMLPVTAVNAQSWRVRPAGFALGLVYHPIEPPAPPAIVNVEPENIPTPPTIQPPPRKHVLTLAISAMGMNEDGTEVAEPVLSIERLHVTEMYPMLHYVFFDDGSAQIPSRYHQRNPTSRDTFSERSLFTAGAMEIHHNVLDIVGKRLQQNPKSSMTIVGTRSTHSEGDANANVAKSRAESVASYLEITWGIAPERLKIRSRDLPELASDDQNPFGQAENRRVEFVPSSDDITSPLRTERTERVANPPRITFDTKITSSDGVRAASIVVKQGSNVLQTFDALAPEDGFVWTVDAKKVIAMHDSLTYTLTVVDSVGDTSVASGILHLKQQTHDRTIHASDTSIDKETHKYSLILFDYSSSQLDRKQSEEIVSDMASSVEGGSAITLTGHTDKTGDDQFNDRLSKDRVNRAAEMLQSALRRSGKGKPPMQVESHGSRDNLFDNSLPEGRVLSRTVRAIIEKEVAK
jgi:outer membrane protein OmpA-like peptidoglycan-associated protein